MNRHRVVRFVGSIIAIAVTISLEGAGAWALESLFHRWSTPFAYGGGFIQAFDGAWVIGGSVLVMIAMFALLVACVMFVIAGIIGDFK